MSRIIAYALRSRTPAVAVSPMEMTPAAHGTVIARPIQPPVRGTAMPIRSQDPAEYSTLAERCAMAIADANRFRHMATRALRDGAPRAQIRAHKARTTARIILMHAKKDLAMHRMIVEAAAGEKAT